MKKNLLRILFTLSGNKFAQNLLEKVFTLVRILLGIGSGSFPSDSGEQKIFDVLIKLHPIKDETLTIFDVGANEGQFLQILLNKLENENYRIYAFEPTTAAFQELSNTFFSSDQIFLENLGLDNITHRSKIFYDFPKSLRASKYQRDLKHLGVDFSLSEDVNYVTLDDYCETNQITNIDLLKIDVEGNEYNVLKGSEEMLSRNAVHLIAFEFSRAHIDSRTYFKDIYYFLKEHKMKFLYRVMPNGYLKPIEKYDEKLEMFFPTNYLALMQ